VQQGEVTQQQKDLQKEQVFWKVDYQKGTLAPSPISLASSQFAGAGTEGDGGAVPLLSLHKQQIFRSYFI
jgi:hypothetical protein